MLGKLMEINLGCLIISLGLFLLSILIISGFVILGFLKFFIFGG
jgi:hypothetical protein|nr:MAG TPA: hypothetical protein [Caudoviricetes sp.]